MECSGKSRINPGNASTSYLVDKIMGQSQTTSPPGSALTCFMGAQMPFGGPFLSAADVNTIVGWINAGAN